MAEVRQAVDFFGLRRVKADRWSLTLDETLVSGTGALFGGAALGVAAAVVEALTARSLVWISVQFVTHVRPPSVVQIDIEELPRGRRASQVSGVARLDGVTVFTIVATVGAREPVPDDGLMERHWELPPEWPPPESCPPRPVLERHRGRFMERTEARVVPTSDDNGRSAVWARLPELQPGTATLAVLGDYVPFGLRRAVGDGWATHSLDNTLRVLRPAPAGWVLVDVAIEGVAGGFGHGRVQLWDEQAHLLGTASQSFTFRPRSQRSPARHQ